MEEEITTIQIDPPLVVMKDKDRLVHIKEIHSGKDFFISLGELVGRLNMVHEACSDLVAMIKELG